MLRDKARSPKNLSGVEACLMGKTNELHSQNFEVILKKSEARIFYFP